MSPLISYSEKQLELEGLRGILALWVVAFHVVAICGPEIPKGVLVLVDGGHAVDVFIILSGFVIASLVVTRQESYEVFIARRILRIFPVYFVCVLAAIFLQQDGLMPKRYQQDDYVSLLIVHLLLLQGAIPESLISGASSAFLNPTWSTSLEWQFYLVAPFFIRFVLKGFVGLLLSALLVALLYKSMSVLNVSLGGMSGAFLLSKLSLFWIGIVSYLAFLRATREAELRNTGIALFAVVLVVFSYAAPISRILGFLIWILVFSLMLQIRNGVDLKILKLVKTLRLRPVVGLGAISYPLYLSHEPVIWICKSLVEVHLQTTQSWHGTALVALFSMPLSILLSIVLHRTLEKPAIAYGKKLLRN
jgi:peptidoglycan/LPS O-acetylase OafA/YrhL